MNNDETTRRGALRSAPRSPATLRSISISPRQPDAVYASPEPAGQQQEQPQPVAAQPAERIPEPQPVFEPAPAATMPPIVEPVHELSFPVEPVTIPAAEPVTAQVSEPVVQQPVPSSQLLPPPIPTEPIFHPLSQVTQPAPQGDATSRNPVRVQDVFVPTTPKPVTTPVVVSPVTHDDLLDESLSFPDSSPAPQPTVAEEKKSFLKRIFKRS